MLALDDHPIGSLPDDAEVVILVHDGLLVFSIVATV